MFMYFWLFSETITFISHSWLNKKEEEKKKSRAKKSVFTGDSSTEFAEIDVNDPDFWKKVLPDLVSQEKFTHTHTHTWIPTYCKLASDRK
jgi:hypothetical protein